MRDRIIEAVLKTLGDTSNTDLGVIKLTLKNLSDNNLIAFAIDLGIDTDAIIESMAVRS